MPADEVPATLQIALLGEVDTTRDGSERIHAVLAWTDRGERYYRCLTATPRSGSGATAVVALTNELPSRISSAGRTWCTRILDSIPAELRHLPPADVAHVLATRLAG